MENLEQKYITSLEVAEMVEKPHKELLRDIRRYTRQFNESNLALVDFFVESEYKDNKGETRPCFNITKKGCEFIANKLTGVKGTKFTATYINCFHEMEDEIKQRVPMTTSGMIQLLAQGHTELEQKVDAINSDLQTFKEEMPVLALDCEQITNAVKKKGVQLLGGKESNAYKDKSIRSKVYSDIYGELKRMFSVSSYKSLKRNQCDMAVSYVERHELPFVLVEEINMVNAQETLEL